MADLKSLQQFKTLVGTKFQLYNSLFTSLPFHKIEKTGILVSMLLVKCEEGYEKGMSPSEIIEDFFDKQTSYRTEEEKINFLFRLIQYIERQVVLFDGLEEAAFRQVNDMNGSGTLKHLASDIEEKGKQQELAEKLKDYTIRIVLTAHPTQFYRSAVLGIIHDLSSVINANNENQIYTYLQQLGRTPFFQQQKPSPYDEAVSLIWYLENVFYQATGRIITFLKNTFPEAINFSNPIIKMGFWPGGDRDGNPYVTSDVTMQVADALRGAIIKCYYLDVRKLIRRLTFKGVDVILAELETVLYNNLFIPGYKLNVSKEDILGSLNRIRELLIKEHNSLFLDQLESLIYKVEVFGLHFASLDIRQDANVHGKVLNDVVQHTNALPKNYTELSEDEKIQVLTNITTSISTKELEEALHRDTIKVMQTVKSIQEINGESGCNRYIISQCNSALNAMEVFGLFLLSGWKRDDLTVDIIPLFETIEDLQHASQVMQQLYENEIYRTHITKRHNKQTIMLGFSDGTKDGGYLMANWSIYKAKAELTAISKKYDVDVAFFDGRGGPPARGGGKTHKFYASMGKNISNKSIQLTVQGQTVSSNFGTIDSAQYNIEQLMHAGISNDLFENPQSMLTKEQEYLLQRLSEVSYKSYITIKDNDKFLNYLSHASPLQYYAETNIGSRPAKRGTGKLTIKDLRAIPFVGAWSQLKQNLTGYYGVGTALKVLEAEGQWNALQDLYRQSLFFRTLIDNCEMAMKKSYFPLTQFLSHHPDYKEIWNMIYDEYELTKAYVSRLSGHSELMENYPVDQLSIQMRERIVLPLVTIQQYALAQLRDQNDKNKTVRVIEMYKKIIMRSSFGIINAGRNSA